MIFYRKKQWTNAKSGRTKVADWQYIGVYKRCRIGSARVDFRQILRTDFCVQGCYSSIDECVAARQ